MLKKLMPWHRRFGNICDHVDDLTLMLMVLILASVLMSLKSYRDNRNSIDGVFMRKNATVDFYLGKAEFRERPPR